MYYVLFPLSTAVPSSWFQSRLFSVVIEGYDDTTDK